MPSHLATDFDKWLNTPYGEYIQQLQCQMLAGILEGSAGFRAMELLISGSSRCSDKAPQMHCFTLAQDAGQQGIGAACDYHNLPLPSDVVDVALVNHVLDYCEYPHESLKEVARVLQPSGKLLIVGFNPLSPLGLARWLLRHISPSIQWRARGLSSMRLTDWLKLLGFHCDQVLYGGYSMPIQSRRYLTRLSWLERWAARLRLPLGDFYIIVATKQRVRPLMSGKTEWLSKTINPVKLPGGAKVKPGKMSSDGKSQ